MRINICDNNIDDTSVFDDWSQTHNWYRSKDTFQSNFPNNFIFDYWKRENNEVTIFVTKGIYSVNDVDSKIKIAIPSDLREFHSPIYEFIENNIEKFDRVITYDERLIGLYPDKCFPSPAMKPWIWPKSEQQVYEKDKLCSFITSTKTMIPGHDFRVDILNSLNGTHKYLGVDCFGQGHNPLPEDGGKIFGLKDYAFSISMENNKTEYYFSEKLLDVILTGAVPIYWGCKSIGNYFNTEGMLLFDTKEELFEIISKLNMDLYKKMLPAIKENFNLCKKKYVDNFHYFVSEGTEWL